VGKLTEVQAEVLGRPGRFRPVHASLEVKEVVVGEGERRRRYIVCRNVLEPRRQRQHREEVLAALRQELARLDPQAPDHTKRACELDRRAHLNQKVRFRACVALLTSYLIDRTSFLVIFQYS
jgi:hypothetical protein